MRYNIMKKLTALVLVVVMLFSLVACGEMDTDKIRKNLKDAGYTVAAADAEDIEMLGEAIPKETIAGTKGLTENITIFVYDSEDDAKNAQKVFEDAMGELASLLGDMFKTGVKGNTFYMATSEDLVNTAYKGA